MNANYLAIKRVIVWIFWIGFIATLIVTLMPSQSIPKSVIFWDKLQHSIAFFMLMLTGSMAYSAYNKHIFFYLILYGASIEIMQEFFTKSRNGDAYDLVADTVGIFLGWLVFLIIYHFTHKKPAQSR